jgi:DivIVA domain-containing protein
MTLLPADVRDTTFRIARRGYDTGEVDAFLEQLQRELSRLHGLADAAGAVAPAAVADEPDQALSVLRLAESTAAQLLDRARQSAAQADARARDALEGATADAERVRRQAQAAAEQVVAAAEAHAQDLAATRCEAVRAELAQLEQARTALRQEVDALAGLADESRRSVVTLLEQQLSRARREAAAGRPGPDAREQSASGEGPHPVVLGVVPRSVA